MGQKGWKAGMLLWTNIEEIAEKFKILKAAAERKSLNRLQNKEVAKC